MSRQLSIYPAASGPDWALAPGWFSYSWNGQYDTNSSVVAPFQGTACVQAEANPFGALSFYTVSPFTSVVTDPINGWDAIDFWMRGRDALSITVFLHRLRQPRRRSARWRPQAPAWRGWR